MPSCLPNAWPRGNGTKCWWLLLSLALSVKSAGLGIRTPGLLLRPATAWSVALREPLPFFWISLSLCLKMLPLSCAPQALKLDYYCCCYCYYFYCITASILRRLLRVPWTARRSNQSILKDISPGISLKGLMLKLKLHYFGHIMQRVDSLEKTLMLGGIGGRRRRG